MMAQMARRTTLRATYFRSQSRAWFRRRAPAVPSKESGRKHPYASNPDRKLVCWTPGCTPGAELDTANWFSVQCPRCHREAIEEMTPDEVRTVQAEIDQADAMNGIPRAPFAGIRR